MKGYDNNLIMQEIGKFDAKISELDGLETKWIRKIHGFYS